MAYLDGVTYYGQPSLEDNILQNVVGMLKYGLLELGAYTNIAKDAVDYNGNNASLLRPASLPGVTNNTVYEGLTNDWVWESGITRKNSAVPAPLSISGIFINDTFYPAGTTYLGANWYVNYSHGAVIFSSGLSAGTTVKVPRSERAVHTYSVDSPYYNNILAYYRDRNNWSVQGSGIDNLPSNHRAFLPAVFVGLEKYSSVGMEQGSRNKITTATISFNIFAGNASDRRKLTDICFMLEEKAFSTFKYGVAPSQLSISGTIYPSSMTFPQLVANYTGPLARFTGDAVLVKNYMHLPIQYAQIKVGLEIPTIVV